MLQCDSYFHCCLGKTWSNPTLPYMQPRSLSNTRHSVEDWGWQCQHQEDKTRPGPIAWDPRATSGEPLARSGLGKARGLGTVWVSFLFQKWNGASLAFTWRNVTWAWARGGPGHQPASSRVQWWGGEVSQHSPSCSSLFWGPLCPKVTFLHRDLPGPLLGAFCLYPGGKRGCDKTAGGTRGGPLSPAALHVSAEHGEQYSGRNWSPWVAGSAGAGWEKGALTGGRGCADGWRSRLYRPRPSLETPQKSSPKCSKSV